MQFEHEDHSAVARTASCTGLNDCDGFAVVFAALLRLDTGRATVTLAGELNQTAALDADELLRQAGLCAPLIILDLRGVSSIDTAGLRTVIAADARLREMGKRLLIVHVPPQVHRMFELTGTNQRLELADNHALALDAGRR
jgi:anti-anti-sigma factor